MPTPKPYLGTGQLSVWVCHVCKALVYADKFGQPASKYWNDVKQVVYCGPEHSLKDHELPTLYKE
jgi:hypothetical protein